MKAQRRYCLGSPGRLSRSKLCTWRQTFLHRQQMCGHSSLPSPPPLPPPATGLVMWNLCEDWWHKSIPTSTTQCYTANHPTSTTQCYMANHSTFFYLSSLTCQGEEARLVKFLPVLKVDYYIFDVCRMSLSCLQKTHWRNNSLDEIFFSPPLTCLRSRSKCFCDCFLRSPRRLTITPGATWWEPFFTLSKAC